MRLGLVVLLSLAVCAAQTSDDNQRDIYYPAPYFDEGENLSIQNCGTNETTRNEWIFYVQNIRCQEDSCFNFIAISQRTFLTPGRCPFNASDATNLRVFPRNCFRRETEGKCIRLSVKVLDVIEIAIDPGAYCEFTIVITEKMPSVVSPFCLFHRDNAMDLLQLETGSTYFQWSPWSNKYPPIPTNVKGQSNCSTILTSAELRRIEILQTPIQNILCVEETTGDYYFLINYYKGRYFLRGIKYFWDDGFFIDILPFIDEIAMHAKDISALRPIPDIKQPRGFTEPDNLSFPNCGRKRGKDDSSSELPANSSTFGENIVQTGDHPWHVYFENEETGEACGGTLISSTVVLTAAHCIYGSEAEDFRVALGMYDKRKRRAPSVQRRKPSNLITHPKYDSKNFISDVGLLILKKEIKMTDNVRPICLWNDDSDPNLTRIAGTEAMVVGFGLAVNYTLPDKLQEVRLPIRTHKECYLSKRNFFGKYLRPGDNFCAGYTNGTTVCKGDSGGSFSVEKDGRWFIRGIRGEERSFCHPDQFSLFADVASYVDWIVENTPDISFRN